MDEPIDGFIWLEWVIEKLLVKHNVTAEEVEEAFSNTPYKVLRAPAGKYLLYARSNNGRYLLIVFTWVGSQVKIISARDMTSKERHFYARK